MLSFYSMYVSGFEGSFVFEISFFSGGDALSFTRVFEEFGIIIVLSFFGFRVIGVFYSFFLRNGMKDR